jgi:hypothetical protein
MPGWAARIHVGRSDLENDAVGDDLLLDERGL